ncbi:MAG TPA: CHAT domain-containing protein [Candidatus Angelobacter sp.]
MFPRHFIFSTAARISCLAAIFLPVATAQDSPKASAGQDTVSTPLQTLELQKPISRQIQGGESHEYQIALEAGQYALVTIDQKSINIAIAALGPDGKSLYEEDVTPPGELENASLIASVAGLYRIRVTAPDKASPAGEYQIKLAEIQTATDTQKSRVAADRAMGAAMALYYQRTAESRRGAIQKCQEALENWRAVKDAKSESIALGTIGFIYKELGERQKALEFLNQALAVTRAANDQLGEARVLDYLGYAYENFGDKKQALELFKQALPLWRTNQNRNGELRSLNGVAICLAWLGEKREAITYLEQALVISRELRNEGLEATLLSNMAVTYGQLGDYQKELELANTVLAIQRRLNMRYNESITLNNIGSVYSNLGDYQKAMDNYTAALNIARELGGAPQDEAIDLNNVAWIYSASGDFDNALKYYLQSVEILRKVKDTWRLATSLTNLGATYADLHQYEKALEIYQESLALNRTGGNRNGEANTLNNMAFAYGKLGDKPKSLDYYLQGLTIFRSLQDKTLLAQALRNVGTIYRVVGEKEKALAHLNESIEICKALGDRRGEAEALGQIAHVELDQGDLAAARKHSDEALAIFDSLRSTITNPRLRAWFSTAGRKVRETNLQVLVQLHRQQPSAGYDAAAMVAAENMRARSLLELLGQSQAKIREGVDQALLERETSLRQTIAFKARQQQRLLAGRHTNDQAVAAADELDNLTQEYDQLQSAIREKSPAYAALTMPVPLNLSEIQQNVLDQETLLLEYALGEDKSFLFAVTPQSIAIFELPKRETVETAARNVYDLLTAFSRTVEGETPQKKIVRVKRAQAEYPEAAAKLSHLLLDPIASQLESKRLLIVAEGALQYIPFTGLPDLTVKTPGEPPPLIAGHDIITAPSASVLALIRRDVSHRPPAEKLVAVLADPVFDKDDARVAQRGKSASAAPSPTVAADLLRSSAESGLQQFTRLRFSRQEADRIARLAQSSGKLTALDFAASRTTATSQELGQYRIIHFATHGLINNQHPELSGLVLSLVNERGEPVDGFLRLNDVYNLKLQADLVVLSACQTALGKEMAGEGLIGLTRGFVYAGAPRVVASLWQVDDRVTAELMERFYQAMLVRNERPAAALRTAQLAISKIKGWESPFYWAAFTLQGEWK